MHDGVNLWPLISADSSVGPRQYFHYFAGTRPGAPANHRGVRDARWKLLTRMGKDDVLRATELYDLNADPSERFDRLEAHPAIGQRLMGEIVRFRTELKEQQRPYGQVLAK